MASASILESHLPMLEKRVDDAIIRPEGWPRVLDYASSVIGASTSALVVRRKASMEMIEPVAATWPESATRDYLEHFGRMDVIPERMGNGPRDSSVLLQELVDMRSFKGTEFFNDWACKHEVAYFVGITFDIDEHLFGVLSFHRPTDDPEFDTLERKFIEQISVPMRFALRHRRLTKEITAARGALDRWPMGVILMDERGGVLYPNRRASEIIAEGDGITVRNNRLLALEPGANSQLERLIRQVLGGYVKPSGLDLIVPRKNSALPLHIVGIPVSRELCESLWDAYFPMALFINDMREEQLLVSLSRVLQHVFGLTPLQAHIACRLAEGFRNKDLVTQSRKAETVKSHVRAIYNKLKVHSRAELCQLLQRIVMPLRKDP